MAHTILIVDDEEDIRLYLKTFFEKEGYTTIIAADGVEGFKMLKEHKPDLITLDLQMPNDTGTDFYRKMHRDKELNEIPVIVISGLAGRHLAVKKPVAVFDKPVDTGELLEAVKKALG